MSNSNIDNLLKSVDRENIPNSFQEILYDMNNQIKSLFIKLNLIESQNQDAVIRDYLSPFLLQKSMLLIV